MALRNVNTSVYYLNRRANLIKSAKLKDITAPVPQYHRLLELKKAKNVGELSKIYFMLEFITLSQLFSRNNQNAPNTSVGLGSGNSDE